MKLLFIHAEAPFSDSHGRASLCNQVSPCLSTWCMCTMHVLRHPRSNVITNHNNQRKEKECEHVARRRTVNTSA